MYVQSLNTIEAKLYEVFATQNYYYLYTDGYKDKYLERDR